MKPPTRPKRVLNFEVDLYEKASLFGTDFSDLIFEGGLNSQVGLKARSITEGTYFMNFYRERICPHCAV